MLRYIHLYKGFAEISMKWTYSVYQRTTALNTELYKLMTLLWILWFWV